MLFVRDVPGSEWCALWARYYTLLLISMRSRNNWLFILEYSLVLVSMYLVNRNLKRFDLLHLSDVDRNIHAYSRIIFFYFFRLNRTLRHPCIFINGYDVTQTVVNNRLLLWLVEIPIQHFVSVSHFKLYTLCKSSLIAVEWCVPNSL